MAVVEIGLFLLFAIIVCVLVGVAFFFWGIKYALALAINSVIGFFALHAVKEFFLSELIINIWSVLFVAIGGIIGFGIVLAMHGIGIWF